MSSYPQRIVCLTEETTETLYRLGAGDRIVGVSGYTVRPPEARSKPKVSAFLNARFDKIDALAPDLVLAFSDLQADLAAELVRRGYTVVTFNQRSVARDPADDPHARRPGRARGSRRRAGRGSSSAASTRFGRGASGFPRRPRVFFEEWDDPLISGIRWVEELDRDRRRHPCLPGASRRRARQTADRAARAVRRGAAGGDLRLLVRQEGAQRTHRRPAGLARRFPRFATGTSTRSNRRTSCSPARRP